MARIEITQDEWSKHQDAMNASKEMRARVRGAVQIIPAPAPKMEKKIVWRKDKAPVVVVMAPAPPPQLPAPVAVETREPLCHFPINNWAAYRRPAKNLVPHPMSDGPGHEAKRILQLIAEAFGLTVVEMKSNRRSAHLVIARHVAIYAIAMRFTWSLPKIGRYMGGLDHTTILHAVRRVDGLIAEGRMKDPMPYLYPNGFPDRIELAAQENGEPPVEIYGPWLLRPRRQVNQWTPQQEAQLLHMSWAGKSDKQIGIVLGRSTASIGKKRQELTRAWKRQLSGIKGREVSQ